MRIEAPLLYVFPFQHWYNSSSGSSKESNSLAIDWSCSRKSCNPKPKPWKLYSSSAISNHEIWWGCWCLQFQTIFQWSLAKPNSCLRKYIQFHNPKYGSNIGLKSFYKRPLIVHQGSFLIFWLDAILMSTIARQNPKQSIWLAFYRSQKQLNFCHSVWHAE